MKSLNINRENNIVNIHINSVVLNNRKSTLRISDKMAEEKYNKIISKVKSFSKFKKLSLSYHEIDYYDNIIDIYHTPYIYFEKGSGKRKPVIEHCQHGCIPKEWEETFTLLLEDPKTIKPIEVFLSQFNIKLNSKQIKEVRKAMKGEETLYLDF